MFTIDNTTITTNFTMTDNSTITDNSNTNDLAANITIIVDNSTMHNLDNDYSLNNIIRKAINIIQSNVNIKIINDHDAKIIDDNIAPVETDAKILSDIIAPIKTNNKVLGDVDFTNNTATPNTTAASSTNTANQNA